MTQETALGAALKSAVQTMSKKKQTDMIAEYLYSKYDVFKRFKPLAIGIEKDLVEALPQFDAVLIHRVLSNHCRRPKYLKAVARGGKRFNLNNRFQGEVSEQEQQYALSQPNIREEIEKNLENLLETILIKNSQDKIFFRRDYFQTEEIATSSEILRSICLEANMSLTRPQLLNFLEAIKNYQPGKKFNLPKNKMATISRDFVRL